MSVRSKIKQIRENRGLSTYKLSEIMTNNGFKISQSTISKIENGNKKIDVDILQAIAKALGVKSYELMDFEELKKEVINIGETEKLLNILGYQLKPIAPSAGISGISQEESERQAMEITELIENDTIPIYEVYYDDKLITKLTNSQYNQLKENIRLILDYELYKLSKK
ncbi:helix-turn-helix domain-containing protein [Haloimpatiens lingqiaonensis]|uniref:helix-turn-helix domain-containing protein n=1 Tax=Haloimpatiens lingqiaonensis TaxID=1380675 RepID=UPI0010FD163B|nr:helix-turn-helix transcriptional regulator [Haloimpatiens lingqiaonensis]